MPPKAKHTKEDIISAAFELARTSGIESVMTRSVAEKLGTSTSPVFTAFSGIEELRGCVRKRAEELYLGFSDDSEERIPAFLRFCLRMTGFAKAEPKLFSLLFAASEGEERLFGYEESQEQFCSFMSKDYALSREDSEFFFSQFWVYTFGLSSLIASGTVEKTQNEIKKMLSDEFRAQYVLIKSGNR